MGYPLTGRQATPNPYVVTIDAARGANLRDSIAAAVEAANLNGTFVLLKFNGTEIEIAPGAHSAMLIAHVALRDPQMGQRQT